MLNKILRHQLFIPIAALVILIVFNLILGPSFFTIELIKDNYGDPILSGNLIAILNFGSSLAILAVGMTFVTAASGGQDISVGATMAIAGSVIMRILCGTDPSPETLHAPIIVAFLVACVVAMLFGAFNGTLVAVFKIPPMVATLILYTAGRSIAAWINNNRQLTIRDRTFRIFGNIIPGCPIPTAIFIAAIMLILTVLALRFTNLGLYTQAVGINESSSRLNGIHPQLMKFLSFVILGFCAAVAALILTSRQGTMNYSSMAKDVEMDAILAVALGGNALGGGKFNMWASVLGAYVIQFLMTTLYRCNVSSDAISAYKAVVVIILVVLSAPPVRAKLQNIGKKKTKTAKEVA